MTSTMRLIFQTLQHEARVLPLHPCYLGEALALLNLGLVSLEHGGQIVDGKLWVRCV
jgi:hypothetical protein